MSEAPLSPLSGQRSEADRPPVVSPLRSAPEEGPHAEDMVLLPRHLADAAYHVVHAIHALKDDGGSELYRALGKALGRGQDWVPPQAPPCASCHVDVSHGLPHGEGCTSDDAVRHRVTEVPRLAPES